MKVEIIKTTDEFKKLKLEWEELESTEKDATIFQTFLYNYTWWETVEKLGKYQLNIIVVREDNGNLLGVSPLVIELEKKLFFKIETIKFMAWGDYLGFLLKTDNTNTGKIISKIFETIEKMNIDRVLFSNIESNSILGEYCLKDHKYKTNMSFQAEAPKINIKSYENFKDYLSKNKYEKLNKLKNRLSREINYQFQVSKNSEIDFKKMREIHIELQEKLRNAENKEERSSLYLSKERNEFLEKLYNNSKNILVFSYRNVENNEIICYRTCYLKNNRLIAWNRAHSYKYHKFSTGAIINYDVIDWCFKNGIELFDYGAGGYAWKFQTTRDFTNLYLLEYNVSNNKKMKYFEKFKLIKRGIGCFIKALQN